MVLSAVAAALSFILLYLLTPIDLATMLFISLGVASSVGAITAMDRGESIGEVVGFAVLLLLLLFSGWLLPSRSAIVFALPSNQVVVIDAWSLPLILLGIVVLFALVKYLGGNTARFGLWIISVALTLAYFTYSDAVTRILIAATQALIVFLPVAQGQKTGLLAVAPITLAGYDKVLAIDLSSVNVYAACLIPVLAFVALDPLNRINRVYRSLAALVVLMIVFLQVLSVVLKF